MSLSLPPEATIVMTAQPTAPITIVSGLPRSGTSMMMMMLEAGGLPTLVDTVRGADEDNPRGYYEFEPVKKTKSDASWVPQSEGRAVKIIHILLYDMPPGFDYRVVLMRRDLNEVVRSQTAMLGRQGCTGASLSPERLATVFGQQLDRLVAWLDRQPNFTCIQIDHGDVILKPAEQAGRIASFLGDDLDVEAMAAAVDHGLYRQRT